MQIEFKKPEEALEAYSKGDITEEQCINVIKAFPTGVKIPIDFFEYSTVETMISKESNEHFEIEEIIMEGQPCIKIKNAQFPLKTFVTPEILASANVVKAIFIESIKILSTPIFIPSIAVAFLSNRLLNKIVYSFNRLGMKVFSSHILKTSHLTNFGAEFQFVAFTMLHQSGIKEEEANRFAEILSNLIEHDNAYRLRIEDVFSSMEQKDFEKPIRTMLKLRKMIKERDTKPVYNKMKKVIILLCLALCVPRFRKAVKHAMKVSNYKNLQLDDNDTYWACMRTDYHFMGMKFNERQEYAKSKGWTFPSKLE